MAADIKIWCHNKLMFLVIQHVIFLDYKINCKKQFLDTVDSLLTGLRFNWSSFSIKLHCFKWPFLYNTSLTLNGHELPEVNICNVFNPLNHMDLVNVYAFPSFLYSIGLNYLYYVNTIQFLPSAWLVIWHHFLR